MQLQVCSFSYAASGVGQRSRYAGRTDLNRPALFKAITQATHHGSDTMLNRHGQGEQIGKQ